MPSVLPIPTAGCAPRSRSSGFPAGRRMRVSRSRSGRARPRRGWRMRSACPRSGQARSRGNDREQQPMSERAARLGRSHFRLFRAIPTRWSDNDAYGHVNNVVYYEWFDTAVNAWLVENGFLDIVDGAVINLVVETSCSYFESISYPEQVEIGIAVERLGTSSVTYA